MNAQNLNAIITRYQDNFAVINNKTHDEIFKWHAMVHFQSVWMDSANQALSFAEKFKKATNKCDVMLNNKLVTPTTGIVRVAEQAPAAVQQLFDDILFSTDGGNLTLRQTHIDAFLGGIDALLQQHFPELWKLRQDRHSASVYLTMFAPQDNYIYKASEAAKFARYIEYGVDIGTGEKFNLTAYYGMCALVRKALDDFPDLIAAHKALRGNESTIDDDLHMLVFDIIHCAAAYNYFNGLTAATKAQSIRAHTQQQLRDREQAARHATLDKYLQQIDQIEQQIAPFASISLLHVQVHHKQLGEGVVIAQKENVIEVQFATLTRKFSIHKDFPARPTFADDVQIVEIFTQYIDGLREIKKLRSEMARV